MATGKRVSPQHSLDGMMAPGLKRVVHACLERDPGDRLQTARDLRRELEWMEQNLALQSASDAGKRPIGWARAPRV